MASVEYIKKVANHALLAVYTARRNRQLHVEVGLLDLIDKFLHEPRDQKVLAFTFREKSCNDVIGIVIHDSKIKDLNGHFDKGNFYFSWPNTEGTLTTTK